MTSRSLCVVLAGALLLFGCGGEESSDSPPPPPKAAPAANTSALCTPLRTQVTGRIEEDSASELSGLVLSRSQRDVLWTHNDSGNDPRVLAVAPDGRLLADIEVTGADNRDWEAMAIGPAPEGGEALYVGDIGDNDEERDEVVVYRVPEPRLAGGPPSVTAMAQSLTLSYPDGPHNAEALLVDPASGGLVIVTKHESGTAGVYVAQRPSSSVTTLLRRAGTVSLGSDQLVTAGDVSADGRTIALRTYDHVYVWSRRLDESLASALRRPPCIAAVVRSEGKGESLTLTQSGGAFYTVPEGDEPQIRRYAPVG